MIRTSDLPRQFAASRRGGLHPGWLLAAVALLVLVVVTRPTGARTADPLTLTEHEVAVDGSNFAEIAARHGVTLLDFSTSWCGPCRSMAPIVQDIAAEYEGVASVGVVDGDNPKASGLMDRFQVRGYPHFVILSGEEIVREFAGTASHGELTAALDEAVGMRESSEGA